MPRLGVNYAQNLFYGPDVVTQEADERARELLVETLTPEQREAFEQHGEFTVTKPHRTYVIGPGHIYAEGRNYGMYAQGYSEYDRMLAVKLMLETDEARFLRTACRT